MIVAGRSSHPGSATGPVLLLDQPISFWGGVNSEGVIIDVHHPHCGFNLKGKILAMPSGRGSSSSTAILAELIRNGNAPAAIVMKQNDTILVIGALVAKEMYGKSMPIITLQGSEFDKLKNGEFISITAEAQSLHAYITL